MVGYGIWGVRMFRSPYKTRITRVNYPRIVGKVDADVVTERATTFIMGVVFETGTSE